MATSEILRSVEVVWVVWLASAASLTLVLRRTLAGFRRPRLLCLARDEEGAAYSLSYVMVLPIYAFLICLVVESTLILVVKMGTIYAAYAATRSRIVWRSASPALAEEKMRLAAAQALAPFASSDPGHARGGSSSGADSYVQAYRKYTGGGTASPRYLSAKYSLAMAATRVSIRVDGDRPDADITATVSYEMPLNVPGIGRLLGTRSVGNYYVRTITSAATLQDESPCSDSRTLGIDYESR